LNLGLVQLWLRCPVLLHLHFLVWLQQLLHHALSLFPFNGIHLGVMRPGVEFEVLDLCTCVDVGLLRFLLAAAGFGLGSWDFQVVNFNAGRLVGQLTLVVGSCQSLISWSCCLAHRRHVPLNIVLKYRRAVTA
jgi:hypothetical protein